MSKSSVHNIICKDLKLSKIVPKFIPKDLTDDQKNSRLEACRANIELVRDDPSLLQCVTSLGFLFLNWKQNKIQLSGIQKGPESTTPARPLSRDLKESDAHSILQPARNCPHKIQGPRGKHYQRSLLCHSQMHKREPPLQKTTPLGQG